MEYGCSIQGLFSVLCLKNLLMSHDFLKLHFLAFINRKLETCFSLKSLYREDFHIFKDSCKLLSNISMVRIATFSSLHSCWVVVSVTCPCSIDILLPSIYLTFIYSSTQCMTITAKQPFNYVSHMLTHIFSRLFLPTISFPI